MEVVKGLAGKDTRLSKTLNIKSEVNRNPEYTVYKCSFGHLFKMYFLWTQNVFIMYSKYYQDLPTSKSLAFKNLWNWPQNKKMWYKWLIISKWAGEENERRVGPRMPFDRKSGV